MLLRNYIAGLKLQYIFSFPRNMAWGLGHGAIYNTSPMPYAIYLNRKTKIKHIKMIDLNSYVIS